MILLKISLDRETEVYLNSIATSLAGKTVLITGACGHIGRELCSMYASLGCNLIAIDIKKERSEFFLNFKHITCDYFYCDLGNAESRNDLINMLLKYSSIDVLINNAAYIGSSNLSGWSAKFQNQSLETWDLAMNVNLTSAFHLSQAISHLLSNNINGKIINVASIYGFLGPNWSLYEATDMANPAAYATSKGGLIQLKRWLSTTLAPNINVNAISPGGIYRNQPEEFVARYIEKTPLGRMASVEDLLGTFLFLSSDMSNYITGQNIIVDGGWSTW